MDKKIVTEIGKIRKKRLILEDRINKIRKRFLAKDEGKNFFETLTIIIVLTSCKAEKSLEDTIQTTIQTNIDFKQITESQMIKEFIIQK